MSDPLVSVVIPVFNGMTYLEQTLASVRAQDYPRVELVLVDGGSTDGSREWVAAQAGAGVVVDALPPGTPAGRTWSRATELATGDFVKLVCQDDLLYPTALTDQVADLLAQPSAGMAIATRDMVSASGRALSRGRGCAGLPDGLVDGSRALVVAARKGANIFGEPLAVLFRREPMQAALPWDDARPFLLDMFFYAKVLRTYPVVVRHSPVGAFRISATSWSTALARRQKEEFRDWQRMVETEIAPQPAWRVAQARLNNQRTVLLRRAAYAWLSLRGDLSATRGR